MPVRRSTVKVFNPIDMMFGRINWKPTKPQVRTFAITLLIAFLLFAFILLLLGKGETALKAALIGFALSMFSFFIPPLGRIVYLIWMAVSFLLGRITSPVITALIFCLVVIPIGLVFRLIGRDNLNLRRPLGKDSYFSEPTDNADPEHFERQF
ncbi:MAG: hypothetical protein KAT58_07340 [candidate division Zixibacteria bacterium]|nr:hypothetical protein [candidate division Zixibacteria bacterium]